MLRILLLLRYYIFLDSNVDIYLSLDVSDVVQSSAAVPDSRAWN